MVERRSINSIHAHWRTDGLTTPDGGWYIETCNREREVLDHSDHAGWEGPNPRRYQADEAQRLRTDLQNWEPEARVLVHAEPEQ